MISNRFQKGFTLVEVLVASSIFVVIMTISSVLIAKISRTNYKTNVARSSQQDVRFAMELISRDARTAQGTETVPSIKMYANRSSDNVHCDNSVVTSTLTGDPTNCLIVINDNVTEGYYVKGGSLWVNIDQAFQTPKYLNLSPVSSVVTKFNVEVYNPNDSSAKQNGVRVQMGTTANCPNGGTDKVPCSDSSTRGKAANTQLETYVSSRDYGENF